MEIALKRVSRNFMKSSNLVVYPSFFREVSRNLDLWGKLDEYRYSPTEEQADIEALRRDYMIAIKDIKKAYKCYEIEKRK